MKPRWTICLGVFGGACLGLAASPFLSRFPFRVPHRDSLVAASSAGKAQTFNKDNHHTQVFELNSTFTEAPSPQSNRAWAALIPGMLYLQGAVYPFHNTAILTPCSGKRLYHRR